jgi:hypothetical protein
MGLDTCAPASPRKRQGVDYHESDNGHWIERAHAADAKAWLAETLALAPSWSGG